MSELQRAAAVATMKPEKTGKPEVSGRNHAITFPGSRSITVRKDGNRYAEAAAALGCEQMSHSSLENGK